MATLGSNMHLRARPNFSCHRLSTPLPVPAPPIKPTCSSESAAGRSRSLCCNRRDFVEVVESEGGDLKENDGSGDVSLYSISPLPLLLLGALPGAETVKSVFGPFVELVKTLNTPDWLVHWGHPGNMAVVLFAMGGYGTYLGFRIKFSDDVEEKANAKDLHPKLLGGMSSLL